jgi:CHAT domain-containing protein
LLTLSPAGDDSGVLYAREIYGLAASRTQLVVLAGCGTASGYVPDNEGMTNLARAFLAAGVPAVVASLWDIDDRRSADFLYEFHRRLSQGADVVSALRQTQIHALKEESEISGSSLWGSFQIFLTHSSR